MRHEIVLAAVIASVVVASVLAAAVAPGVLAKDDPGDLRPSHLDVREVTIAPGDVSDGTATLSLTTHLEHRGGDAENVTLRVRAVDLDSGLVESTREVDVAPISGNREVRIPVDVSVAREGGYRIETILYEDERRLGSVARAVRGVGTLQSGGRVGFHRFRAGLPSVQYSVVEAEPNRTTLELSTYLTNSGAEPSAPVTVELIVRQADSNVVAARTTVDAGRIAPGETISPETTVAVPAGYNYYLDAVLRKGNVVVDTTRSAANLDPEERLDADTTVRDVGLRVEDFERGEGGEEPAPDAPTTTVVESGGQPGFGLPAALAAVVTLAAVGWRWRR